MKMYVPLQCAGGAWGCFLGAFLALVSPMLGASSAAPLYEEEVLPILSENCFHCHGPDEGERKAGLRLDEFDSATKELKSGSTAIVQ